MAEDLVYPFSQERIEAQARGNVNAFILGSIAYAKAQGQDGRHWATFIGTAFAPGWTNVTTPHEAAAAVALNCESTGVRVVSVEGDDSRGETTTENWPDPELLGFVGLSQADADQLWDLFAPIARSLGYTYAWRREGGHLHFTFAK
jgi:hypothetical protein